MKKIILAVISFTMFFIKVNAIDNEKEQALTNTTSNYSNTTSEDKIYLEYSNWQDYCLVNPNEYEIEYKNFYHYKNAKSFKYIILTNSNNINFKKITIYSNNEIINYKEITEEENLDESLLIELEHETEYDNFKIELEYDNQEITDYIIYFTNDYKKNNLNIFINLDTNINEITEDMLDNNNYYLEEQYDSPDKEYIELLSRCRYRKNINNNYILPPEQETKQNNNNESKINEIKYNENINSFNTSKYQINSNSIIEYSTNDTKNNNDNKKEYRNKTTEIENIKPNNKFINTLKVSNNKTMLKYIIIIVIGLTLIYIIISNKKANAKK